MRRFALSLIAWALVSTSQMTIKNPESLARGQDPDDYNPTITVPAHTAVNMIVYDGNSKYTPPKMTELFEVPNDTKIGDTVTE